jgi:hypothetical protein
MAYNTKQYHTRRLKPLKTILNPTVYQFILWTTNQKWWYDFKHYTKSDGHQSRWNYKLWK